MIHLVARMGKTLEYRELDETYGALREWHKVYEAAHAGVAQAKGAMHRQLKALFPDYSFAKDFLYHPSGRALMDRYGANPYRIVKSGKARFARVMRNAAPRIQHRSIERLWRDASISVRNRLGNEQVRIRELRLRHFWEEFLLHDQRKIETAAEMERIYEQLRMRDRRRRTTVPENALRLVQVGSGVRPQPRLHV